ncbi:MAG: endonuclease VIII [Oscillospiraceae bacterium]|nr:endonuclease VIII [Oscillospiraceae bacterium]
MIELPEALTLAKELKEALTGKTVARVLPPTKPHRFCWFNGEAADYEGRLRGSKVVSARGFGIYVEILFDSGLKLAVNDGVNLRLLSPEAAPGDYQLLIQFSDGAALVFTVAMYGGIVLHDGGLDDEYYCKSLAGVSPFSPEFEQHFYEALGRCKPKISAKAFLATQQRFPGIGNGTLQDILFAAGVNPRRGMDTLTGAERERLLSSVVSVLGEMTEKGGRDTEKDLYGKNGGYLTKMSKNTLAQGCPACGGSIVKEAYLGGSVYYCPRCQAMPAKGGK